VQNCTLFVLCSLIRHIIYPPITTGLFDKTVREWNQKNSVRVHLFRPNWDRLVTAPKCVLRIITDQNCTDASLP
jgi:hypothetical protein